MDQQQWSPYTETPASNRQRYAPHTMATPQHQQRDASVPQIKQDPYASPQASSRTGSMALQSPGAHTRGSEYNDGDGDVRMEDAADPYKPKHSTSRSGAPQQRQSQHFLQQEESAAARRYSPMNLSPTSPYPGNTQQGGQAYTGFSPPQNQSNRQSPTRNNPYMSPPNSYYSPPSKFRPN